MLNASVMAKKEKRSELIGALVTPAIKTEVEKIVESEERSLSFVAGALIERGLEAYKRDRTLRPKAKDIKPSTSASNSRPR